MVEAVMASLKVAVTLAVMTKPPAPSTGLVAITVGEPPSPAVNDQT
jgi:hypothetical protein